MNKSCRTIVVENDCWNEELSALEKAYEFDPSQLEAGYGSDSFADEREEIPYPSWRGRLGDPSTKRPRGKQPHPWRVTA